MSDIPTLTPEMEALVAASVDRALGVKSKPSEPSSAPTQKAPASSPIDQLVSLMTADLASRISERQAALKTPGAAGASAPISAFDENDPSTFLKASAADVERLRAEGKFAAVRDAFYKSLGGGYAPFKKPAKGS